MPHLRTAAIRLVAAVALTLGAGFALSGAAGAAPAPVPAPVLDPIVCPAPIDGDAVIVRPCVPPPCPIYADGATAGAALIYRPCFPPCPIYVLGGTAIRRIWCPPPPPCPFAVPPADDELIYCPLPEL